MITDPYIVLGVKRSASKEEIRSAYRRLARRCHPDVAGQSAAMVAKFREISDAHDAILSGKAAAPKTARAAKPAYRTPSSNRQMQRQTPMPSPSKPDRSGDVIEDMFADIAEDFDRVADGISSFFTFGRRRSSH